MPMLHCPHCQGLLSITPTPDAESIPTPDQEHSAFVIIPEAPQDIQRNLQYTPNPHKVYKTSEGTRRDGLAYYYRNRERVLARLKAARQQAKQR